MTQVATTHMRYSSRLFLYAPFVVLLLVATIAMLRWRQLATEWQTQLQAANRGAEIAPGVTLHFASETIGGFPFNLDAVLDHTVLAVQSTRGPISFASEHFAIHALTYGRAQQIFEAAGRQVLTWTDAGGDVHRFVFVPGTLRASAIENGGRLARFDLDLNALASPEVTATRAQLHIRAARDKLAFVILADLLRTRSATDAVSRLELQGQMTQAEVLSALLSGRDEWRGALHRWSAADGTLRVDHAEITRGDSQLTAEGALRLDDAHRLSGTLRMHVSDAGYWRPTRLVASRFTSALQELVNAAPKPSNTPLSLSLDIHNGAAIARAPGRSRSAGIVEPLF